MKAVTMEDNKTTWWYLATFKKTQFQILDKLTTNTTHLATQVNQTNCHFNFTPCDDQLLNFRQMPFSSLLWKVF